MTARVLGQTLYDEDAPLTCAWCGEGFYDGRDVDCVGGDVCWVDGEPYHEDQPCGGRARMLQAEGRREKRRDE